MPINMSLDDLVRKLRLFLGDSPETNQLIAGFELSDDKLRLALELAVDEFNTTTPVTSYSISQFPSLKVLLHAGAVQALIMAGIIADRNYLQFADGGLSEVLGDRGQRYQAWIAQLVASYKQAAEAIKIQINMEEGWGTHHSPYLNIGVTRGGWTDTEW